MHRKRKRFLFLLPLMLFLLANSTPFKKIHVGIFVEERRSKRFDFSDERLITNWGQVYVQSGETNISNLDFEGKMIVLQDGGIPDWVLWAGAVLLFALLFLIGTNRYLHRRVNQQSQGDRAELALIMDRIPSMVAFVDARQRYIYVDESYATWYGFNKEDVVGKLVKDVLLPENYEKVRPYLDEMFESGKELEYEHRIVRYDGKPADVAVSYIPKLDVDGKVEAFFATVRDVTEEKKAQISLAESEAKYRRLIDNSLIGVYVIQKGQIKFANQGLSKLFGYENTDAMIDLPIEYLIAPQDIALVNREMRKINSGGKQRSQLAIKALRADGTTFDVEAVSETIEYEGEDAIQGMLINITDRVEAEERFRRLSEASYDALFISEKGVCLEQNLAAVKMFGYTTEEAVGRLGTDWIAPEDRDLVMHHMLTGYEAPYRVTALRKDGSTFPAEIVGRSMQFKGRKVRVTALRDITRQVFAEENLRESEQRYRSLIENSQAAMLLFDPKSGDIVDANAAASAYYGWSQIELCSMTIDNLSVEENENQNNRLSNEESTYFISRHRLADGNVRDVEVYISNIVIAGESFSFAVIHDITERREAERKMLESKERFEKVIRGAPIPITITDKNGDIEFYNDKFIEVFGYTLDDIHLAADWWEKVYPDEAYRAQVQAAWKTAIDDAAATGEQIATQTWNMVCKNGDVRMVEFDMMPLEDISVIIMTDISERVSALNALKERERKLTEAQKIGNMGHWELDLINDELLWSEQIYRIFEVDPVEFAASYGAFLETIHPDDRDRVAEAYAASLENKTPYAITHRLLLKNGDIRYVREHCETEYREDGIPIRSLGTVQNITEQVRSEKVMNVRADLAEYALTHSLDEFLRKTLDEAENLTNSKIGFYHFVSQDQQNLSLQQWSRRTLDGYCTVDELKRHYPVDEAGVWVDCIAARKTIVHNDYMELEHRKGLPEGHAELIRELVVPVIRGDKVVAILGVGNKVTNYNEQDVEIVTLVADMCWEIAERKLTEKALRESEDFLNETQQLARLGSYRLYVNAEFWTSNEVLDSIFGIDDEYDRSTSGWLALTHPDDQEMMQAYLTEYVFAEQKAFDKEYRIIQQHTQETRWVHGLGKLEHDGEGRLVSMVGTIQDITARVLADKKLKESEERLRTLINATPDIICFKDGEGRWLAANDADLALFELTDVDYVGKKDSELAEYSAFYHDSFLTCEDTDEVAWLAGGLSRQNEVIPTPHDGDKVYDVIKVPLFNADGSREALVVLGRDITKQVIAQTELQKYTRQLEIVNAISVALSTSLALDDLLKTILQQVVQVISCDSASIFLAEKDQFLRVVNAVGSAERFIGQSFSLEDTLMKKIRPDQEIMIIDDVVTDPDYCLWDDAMPIRGWMGLPLYVRDNLVGYLTFDSFQPQAFGAADASLAVAFATQIAQAIHNARLYERVIADANDLEKHIQERTAELQNFVDLTVGREIRMVELKEMILELRTQLIEAGHVPTAGDSLEIS